MGFIVCRWDIFFACVIFLPCLMWLLVDESFKGDSPFPRADFVRFLQKRDEKTRDSCRKLFLTYFLRDFVRGSETLAFSASVSFRAVLRYGFTMLL